MRSGITKLSQSLWKGRYRIKKIIRHHSYNSDIFDNDVALLKIYGAFPITKLYYVERPVKLPVENQLIAVGTDVTVTGWGMTEVKILFNLKHIIYKKILKFAFSFLRNYLGFRKMIDSEAV